MDLRPPSPSSQQNEHHNAVAGPSSIPLNPPFFLLPPASPPPPPPLLQSTQDLISRFHLLTAYDKFVRPFISQDHDPHASYLPTTPAVAPSVDKGKGKERDPGTPTIASAATPGTHDPDDDEGRDGKKKKNTYRHLIRGIPGKHSIKKDDFLTNIVQVPPKQHIPIAPFDSRTQTEAFTVSLEGLKGWNIHALVPESTQAREDRKKRKELKKLAKAQGTVVPPSVGTPLPSTPATAATPTQPPAQPPRTSTPVPFSRGVKREYEDNALAQPNAQGPGPGSVGVSSSGDVSPTLGQMQRPGSAKAGIPGARPRPLKKQRVDMQGQARDMHPLPPIQQPTPQGV